MNKSCFLVFSIANIGLACEAARKWIQENHNITYPVCNVANHLYAGAKVLAGHSEALKFIQDNKNDFGIRKCKVLPVSGAFHTRLMVSAQLAVAEHLEKVTVADPRILVHSNVNNDLYRDAKTVKKLLPKQVCSPVKWESNVINLIKYEKEEFQPRIIECGPGNSLVPMLKVINGKAYKRASVILA